MCITSKEFSSSSLSRQQKESAVGGSEFIGLYCLGISEGVGSSVREVHFKFYMNFNKILNPNLNESRPKKICHGLAQGSS